MLCVAVFHFHPPCFGWTLLQSELPTQSCADIEVIDSV